MALHQARRIAREPAMRSLGLLIRTWTRYSEPGQPRPHAEQAAHVWDSRLMCGTGRPRVGGGGPTPGSPHRARTRYAEPGPSRPHVDPLFRAWATPPTCGIGGPHAEQAAHVRNRWSACGMRGSLSRCRMRPIRDGSWGSCARSRCSMCIDETIATDDGVDFSVLARLKSRPSSNM